MPLQEVKMSEIIWGVLHTNSRKEFCNMELFERESNAKDFMAEMRAQHPEASFELIELVVNPWR